MTVRIRNGRATYLAKASGSAHCYAVVRPGVVLLPRGSVRPYSVSRRSVSQRRHGGLDAEGATANYDTNRPRVPTRAAEADERAPTTRGPVAYGDRGMDCYIRVCGAITAIGRGRAGTRDRHRKAVKMVTWNT